MFDAMTSSARTPPGGAEAVEHLVGGDPGLRELVGVDAPDAGDVRAGGGVGEHPVAGQLVGLLAVLAPALAVALARSSSPSPEDGRPGRPRASARLIQARAVSEPFACCSAPRAERIIVARDSASRCTARSMTLTGTPVIRSTRSGQYWRIARRTAGQPVVRSAM